MQVPDCRYRISIKALILDKDKRFLLVQEDTGLWELPGGGLEFGEAPQEWLKREIQEEMGIPVVHVAATPSYSRYENEKRKANVIYQAQLKHLEFTSSAECVALRFFSAEEARKEITLYPNVAKFIDLYATEQIK